ncbi:SMP-30/gluconolactonase/LRE family protein [Microbacterium sp. SORGH_AS_0888]|uniref:SMP-30/gluconolactonase/LRE family protein n=1 Tax=Microbacterium sp. SORGH_AS_0888 TaxID=3041791 RepID=UPI002785F4FC|nr:SMP-30/gluconolactonase/LRE family protein [Microbacterium sp. SORGH_AS_0888]MDQ1131000.1 sugar lactone lactonase YvrE [Microbacterium sp. SORGH_AS_0888]
MNGANGSNSFAEGLRWHEGELWYSDMRTRRVVSVRDGDRQERAFIHGTPSGLGWLSDGTLLVSSMLDSVVVSVRDGVKRVHADLRGLVVGPINDLLVDAADRAYVGAMGFDPVYGGLAPEHLGPSSIGVTTSSNPLLLIRPDGTHEPVGDDLAAPNGMALLEGGRVLVVAETLREQLTAFDVLPDGTLTGKRVWARTDGPPDGICAGADGTVWAALLMSGAFARIAEGGTVVERIDAQGVAVDCVVDGDEGDVLHGSVVRGPMRLWEDGVVAGQLDSWRIGRPRPRTL